MEADIGNKPDVTFHLLGRGNVIFRGWSVRVVELFIDFECDCTSDPFRVGLDEAHLQEPYYARCSSVEQVVLHASRLQMHQFRTFVFSVGTSGDAAWLFRWDRSGAVSGPIMYSENGNRELSEFFHRFNLMDRVITAEALKVGVVSSTLT